MSTIQAGVSASSAFLTTLSATNPTNASTSMQGGTAVFENDNYRITAGDNNEINIFNKHTGERYQVWGDPHVNVDGQHAFDFWGTTTFQLDDGTKLTIETTPWAKDAKATLASTVTITNGDYGVRISGVDTNTAGDLKIDEAAGWGELLDTVTDDGNLIQENPTGKGFLAVDAQGRIHAVDQAQIDRTDLTKGGAQLNAMDQQLHAGFLVLSGLLAISYAGSFLSCLSMSVARTIDRQSTPLRDAHASPWRPDLSAQAHAGIRA